MKKDAAAGADMWHPSELAALPIQAFDILAEILAHAELHGEWPQHFHTTWLAPLSKDTPYPTAGKARPISILPTTYRLWATTRLRQQQEHLLEALPAQTHAYLQGRSAQQAALQVAENIEQIQISNQQGQPRSYHILSLDCTKAFPTVSRSKLYSALQALGISPALTRAMQAFYGVNTVKWRLLGSYIEPSRAHQHDGRHPSRMPNVSGRLQRGPSTAHSTGGSQMAQRPHHDLCG